jgi:CBS domain-containing protein
VKLRDVMTPDPACCLPDTPLREVGDLFVRRDCGAIPVLDKPGSRRPVGIVTDRDIVARALAESRNALELKARDCMSTPCLTADEDATLDDCCRLMEANRVRRIVVIDSYGRCCGIVAQADVARWAPDEKTAGMVRRISQPTDSPSALA